MTTLTQKAEASLQEARATLTEAERTLSELEAKATAANAARDAAPVNATDKELIVLGNASAAASERVRLARNAVTKAKQRLRECELALPHAAATDASGQMASLISQMLQHARRARDLRMQAYAIDCDDIGPLFAQYIDVAGIEGQYVDHRYEPPDGIVRDLIDLYELLAREELGDSYRSPWQRTPAGQLERVMEDQKAANIRADMSRPEPPEPRGLTDEERKQLAHCIQARGFHLNADLQLSSGGWELGQLYEIAGVPVPANLPIANRTPLTLVRENEIVLGLPRALNIASAVGKPYRGAVNPNWHPEPPPKPIAENPMYEYSEPTP